MPEKAKTVVWQREAVHEQKVIIKGDRLEAPQLLEAVGQKNQKGTKSRQTHLHRSEVLDVARINIYVMPALQKSLLAENARRKALLLFQTKILHNDKQDNPTLDSFYLDTIHGTEDSNFLDDRCQSQQYFCNL